MKGYTNTAYWFQSLDLELFKVTCPTIELELNNIKISMLQKSNQTFLEIGVIKTKSIDGKVFYDWLKVIILAKKIWFYIIFS